MNMIAANFAYVLSGVFTLIGMFFVYTSFFGKFDKESVKKYSENQQIIARIFVFVMAILMFGLSFMSVFMGNYFWSVA